MERSTSAIKTAASTSSASDTVQRGKVGGAVYTVYMNMLETR